MLRIRLQRIGRKKAPAYRVIVSERTKDTQAGSLEILGRYNPLSNPKEIVFDTERVLHWISVGAQPSATVHNLLVQQGIVADKKKQRSVSITKKRQQKIDDKKAADVEAQKAAEEAKKAAEAEAAAAAATPPESEVPASEDASPESVA